jgi:hypothetical protein
LTDCWSIPFDVGPMSARNRISRPVDVADNQVLDAWAGVRELVR